MRTPNLEMEVAVACEKGARDENQDWLSWSDGPRGELFVVADGMGGHKGGAQAAHMTVEGFEKHLPEAPSDWPLSQALQEASRRTNQEVYQRAQSGDPETENMGSTVVVALVADGTVHIGHVGDSRAYLYRHGRLIPLTRDHTEVQKMVDARMLTPTEARDHPDGHILSRAIGTGPAVEMEIGESRTLENGDALLLCSDGLSGFVEDDAIRQVLERQPDVQRVPGDLVALALAAGASDNITIQFVQFGKRVTPRPVTVGAALARGVALSVVALVLILLSVMRDVSLLRWLAVAPPFISLCSALVFVIELVLFGPWSARLTSGSDELRLGDRLIRWLSRPSAGTAPLDTSRDTIAWRRLCTILLGHMRAHVGGILITAAVGIMFGIVTLVALIRTSG